MEKLERVFVSSTYLDLIEERQAVLQTLLEADCIPAGMELFPASDDDKWSLITRVIDGCDYYIVVIGGRYGSVDPTTALSYTEREFDYAESIGTPIMAFVHADPGKIEANKSELAPEARKKLDAFREKVERRMVKRWRTPEELGAQVAKSLIQLRKSHPAVGWVRASDTVPMETREQIAQLKARVAELELQLERSRTEGSSEVPDLASGEDQYSISFLVRYWDANQELRRRQDDVLFSLSSAQAHEVTGTLSLTWDEIFKEVGPSMLTEAGESSIHYALNTVVKRRFGSALQYPHDFGGFDRVVVDAASLSDVIVQLLALGLIERSERKRAVNDRESYWSLSRRGETHLMSLRAIRRTGGSEGGPI